MKWLDIIRMALWAISKNKIRSVLTALGVVIGVASVIAMVHMGQAATRSVTAQIASMGSNLLIVRPGMVVQSGGRRERADGFKDSDITTLSEQLERVLVAPMVTANATMVYGNANHTSAVTGTNNELMTIRAWDLAQGRQFDERELRAGASVCILGQTVARNIYGRQDPLGTSLRVGLASCQVIGVLSAKGESMGQDQDDTVLMPLKAVQRRLLGSMTISNIYVSALDDGTTPQVQQDLTLLLRELRRLRPNQEDDFDVRDMQEIAQTLEQTTGTLTALLGAIAAVSLLVGGIGIMNIMLVSVTERTREIGIRLAIGALARDVLVQFLVEAIVVSTLGGALGVALGVGASILITSKMGLPFALDPTTVLLAFSFSAAIGVIFGYVPARKAAHLNPIDSLRHE